MANYSILFGCRVYQSSELNGFVFRLEVNYKSDHFALSVKGPDDGAFRKVCQLENAKKMLKYLGYKQKDFLNPMNCHHFMHDLHILKKDVDRYSTFTYRRFKDCIYFY